MNTLKVILLILIASSYSCDEKVSQIQTLPTDEYYQIKEKEYADFKNRFGDPFKYAPDDIPKETKHPINTPQKLIKCLEINMPDLPGISGTLTRRYFDTGAHSFYAGYRTKISDHIDCGTQIDITIYQNYEQARRFSFYAFTHIPQPSLYKPDKENKLGDYSWSTEKRENSPSFDSKILFANLDIHISYSEWAETPSKDFKFPVDASKRKEEVCGPIIKLIQDCQ